MNDASGVGAFCDYDRDGWLDVYVQTNMLDAVAHPHGQRDLLFHNNRDGMFTDVTAAAGISGEACGHSATWWDYDGDGWPDFVISRNNNNALAFRNVGGAGRHTERDTALHDGLLAPVDERPDQFDLVPVGQPDRARHRVGKFWPAVWIDRVVAAVRGGRTGTRMMFSDYEEHLDSLP